MAAPAQLPLLIEDSVAVGKPEHLSAVAIFSACKQFQNFQKLNLIFKEREKFLSFFTFLSHYIYIFFLIYIFIFYIGFMTGFMTGFIIGFTSGFMTGFISGFISGFKYSNQPVNPTFMQIISSYIRIKARNNLSDFCEYYDKNS